MSNMLDRMLRQMAIELIKSQQRYGNLDDVSPRIEDELEYAIEENNTSDDIDDVLRFFGEEVAARYIETQSDISDSV